MLPKRIRSNVFHVISVSGFSRWYPRKTESLTDFNLILLASSDVERSTLVRVKRSPLRRCPSNSLTANARNQITAALSLRSPTTPLNLLPRVYADSNVNFIPEALGRCWRGVSGRDKSLRGQRLGAPEEA